jgi:GNAT superfamily N-acetyltransferase
MTEIVFDLLADRPEYIANLARWFYDEWGRGQERKQLSDYEGELMRRLNRDQLPLTVIGQEAEIPVSTASLIYHEIPTLVDYEHWLASVYVVPGRRGRGLGNRTVRYICGLAAGMRIDELFLYTDANVGFYESLGWLRLESVEYRGRMVAVMRRALRDLA